MHLFTVTLCQTHLIVLIEEQDQHISASTLLAWTKAKGIQENEAIKAEEFGLNIDFLGKRDFLLTEDLMGF